MDWMDTSFFRDTMTPDAWRSERNHQTHLIVARLAFEIMKKKWSVEEWHALLATLRRRDNIYREKLPACLPEQRQMLYKRYCRDNILVYVIRGDDRCRLDEKQRTEMGRYILGKALMDAETPIDPKQFVDEWVKPNVVYQEQKDEAKRLLDEAASGANDQDGEEETRASATSDSDSI